MRIVITIVIAVVLVTTARDTACEPPTPRRPLVVVVAKGSKVTTLSRAELRRTFKSEPVEVDGQRLVPFNFPPGSAERVAFDRAVLEMSSEEVGRFWVDRKIRGQTPAPRTLPSANYVAKLVARFPGAIGYLPDDQVTAELKIVPIDGERAITR